MYTASTSSVQSEAQPPSALIAKASAHDVGVVEQSDTQSLLHSQPEQSQPYELSSESHVCPYSGNVVM